MRDWQYVACLVFVCGFIAAALGVGYGIGGQRAHTTYRTPLACQHAATATLNHLHALADSVGVHVTIKAIHADMAGLQACR